MKRSLFVLAISCGLLVTVLAQEEQPVPDLLPTASDAGTTESDENTLCGNGVCDAGETIDTCKQDCVVEDITADSAVPPSLAD